MDGCQFYAGEFVWTGVGRSLLLCPMILTRLMLDAILKCVNIMHCLWIKVGYCEF